MSGERLSDEELNGHIETVEYCRDFINHQAMDEGDPTGKLRDFDESLRVVLSELDQLRSHRAAALSTAERDALARLLDEVQTWPQIKAHFTVHHRDALAALTKLTQEHR